MTIWPTLDDGRMLVLRTNHPDYAKIYNDFEWPTEIGATATAPDWDPNPLRDCGGGLHGLIWGCGAASMLRDPDLADTTWLVVAVDPADIATPLTDPRAIPVKVRFRACEIVHVGSDRAAAIKYLQSHPGADSLPVLYGIARAGNYGTASAGYSGTATAGYGGTAAAGRIGTATAGDYGTATAGDYGTATAGYGGTATAGNHGTAAAECGGSATVGDYGTATVGDYGTAAAGYSGTATAGEGGALVILFWDDAAQGFRRRCAEVDGERIKANTPYRLDKHGEFIEAGQAEAK